MHRLFAAVLLALWLPAGHAIADTRVGAADGPAAESDGEPGIVVELFTAQGCVACPPADAMMGRLAAREGVIALSLHVDIWDYLGWRDPFAKPAFSERQKSYARAVGARSIFTPQMIVAGYHRMDAIRGMDLADLLRDEAARPHRVRLSLQRRGDMLHILAEAQPPLAAPASVDLVRYAPNATTLVESGENAGRAVTSYNIVTDWESLGQWDGNGPVSFHVRIDGAEPIVVLVQEIGPGAILAARHLR
jgi:hypothetical protein